MSLHQMKINDRGHLEIGDCDTVELARQYGTPLYVYDEMKIRQNARRFLLAFQQSGCSFQVAYASKAFSCIAMAELAEEENLSLDVVSGGELYTALKAGFPAERIHFHGNNKSEKELRMALDAEIGCFVVDNFFELELLHDLAREYQREVKILLRLTPGIEAHTHKYITTGQDDSKFGFNVKNNHALIAIKESLNKPYFHLSGVHFHIGSQIFDVHGFVQAIRMIRKHLDHVHEETGYEVEVLNVGGGFGIQYTEEDHPASIENYIQTITSEVKSEWEKRGLKFPEIWVEPGRSLVGNAAITLYRVGAIKDIPGIRKYVSVDGGMTDNIRPALYQAKYHAVLANRAGESPHEEVAIAGKCCESGDILVRNIHLPKVNSGDLLALFSTGAYGYSMASNYNRLPRPAVVFVKNGKSRIVIKRETYEDLIQNDRRKQVFAY
ncbi:diaminopimelate decarboxylase [Thermoactinomyces mirandus]|uniref:Diaminopimelate decarboxylase n=1 Tax=Thermoactinomyces mirandus TaxID=2756294 RepID=A0A7W1XUQ9_9BACL|nr:diaminopimelate decarboxylase [Thermoactinomyces mirandus]MBA4603615.1 diaminopimelate decarboxylase [Thermoactinomyces mirandus]